MRRALTVAGSDSGGGAGIQADLRTLAALGVHGSTAITAVTSQNTREISSIYPIPTPEIVGQIRAVLDDIGADAVKVGLLPNKEAIRAVSRELAGVSHVVLDPVLEAGVGQRLTVEDTLEALKRDLIPNVELLTPNRMEAELLTGAPIRSEDEATAAAEKIGLLGAESVLVKGGHTPGGEAVDILWSGEKVHRFTGEAVRGLNLHGTGCVLSSAIAAHLAKGSPLPEAVRKAKAFVTEAIRSSYRLGSSRSIPNGTAALNREAEKWETYSNLSSAVELLEESPDAHRLVPELQINIGMALSDPRGFRDIVAVPGRIVKIGTRVKASSCPRYGASHHIANAILAANGLDPGVRAAMNIRFDEHVLEACRESGLALSSYDRRNEPEEVKRGEGSTIAWGTKTAIQKLGSTPDAIWHDGDWGKEAMIEILGRDALDVAEKALRVAQLLSLEK